MSQLNVALMIFLGFVIILICLYAIIPKDKGNHITTNVVRILKNLPFGKRPEGKQKQ